MMIAPICGAARLCCESATGHAHDRWPILAPRIFTSTDRRLAGCGRMLSALTTSTLLHPLMNLLRLNPRPPADGQPVHLPVAWR
jgi:hypothetical protein